MRLTLRTLLAWLDAVLPEDDQKALGAKVAASPVAPQLIARIRDVVERSVLAAPRPEGRGLAEDANSVAEYLDNSLPAERLEPFERICIESDMHLAEVAACHGILAEIARDPNAAGPLDAADRRRLLAAALADLQGDPRGGRRAVDAGGTLLVDPPVARRPASPRRRPPLAAWLSAGLALLLLLGLVGFLAWSIGRDRGRRIAVRNQPPVEAAEPGRDQPAVADARPAVDTVAQEPPAAEQAAPKPAVESVAEPKDPSLPPVDEDVGQPPAPAIADAPVAADPPPPATEPVAAEPVEQPRVPQGDALAIAASPVVPAVPAGEEAADGAKPSADQPVQAAEDGGGGFVSGAGLLFHKVAGEPAVHGLSGWVSLPQNRPLAVREDLIAPPFCRPEVSVGGVTIRLEPNTRATLTHDADGKPRLELVFGRAVVRSSAAEALLGVTAGGLVGVVADGLRHPVGIEVLLERSPGSDPATSPGRVRSTIATTDSGIVWRQSLPDGSPPTQPLQGIPQQGMLEAGGRLTWDSHEPGALTVQVRRDLPVWLAGPPRPDRLDQAAAEALAAKAASDPPEKGLRELADDRRAENRVAAVATLALLGDYEELVALVSAESADRKLEDRQWARLVDMTVPLALARGANAAARLAQAFEGRGPAGRGAEMFAIARGFDDAALAAGADARLVAALDAAELPVRRFAIRGLVEIVQPLDADRGRYRPDRPKDLRREGVAWWRKQLDEGRIRWARGGARAAESATARGE